MKFNEQKTVEEYILKFMQAKLGYEYIPPQEFAKLRQYEHEFIIEPLLLEAVKRINDVDDDKAQEVVREVQKVAGNEEFMEVLRHGVQVLDRESGKMKTYQVVDYVDIEKNQFVVTNQFYFEGTTENIRPDILVFLNGLPVSDIEAKSPSAGVGVSFENAIGQIKRYEKHASKLFIPNCFNVAADGVATVYGATNAGKGHFFLWKQERTTLRLRQGYGGQATPTPSASSAGKLKGEGTIDTTLHALFEKSRLLDIIKNFIVFEYEKESGGKIKKIARYQQLRATNKIVERVREGQNQYGLIWHTQGSGKSLTMFFTAWKLRFEPLLENPKIFVLVDRVDLDDQLYNTFINCGGQNVIRVTSQADLRKKLTSPEAGIFITTIQKFEEVGNIKNPAKNIVVLVDEAHRSNEGINGINMRASLPQAFLFGFTGTPIDKETLNTHRAFGQKGERYLDYYSIQQAIDDGATVPVTYEARLSKFFIDEDKIDEQFEAMTADLSKEQKQALIKKYGKKDALVKLEKRMSAVARDIMEHFKGYVEPSGFKAQVVCYDREATARYKKLFDSLVPAEWSAVVYSPGDANMDSEQLREYVTTKPERERIIGDFKNPNHPLRFLLVCDMLLTGFDAPVEQMMYLDKPLRDHNLLQAIARTNRPYKNKGVGKVIDYYGITRNLHEALNFDEDVIDQAMVNIDELKKEFIELFEKVWAWFDKVNLRNPSKEELDRHLKQFIDNQEAQEQFSGQYRRLNILFETLSPDPFLHDYIPRFEWLISFYLAFTKNFKDDSEMRYALDEYGGQVRQIIKDRIDFEGITKNYRELDIGNMRIFDQLNKMDDEEKALNLEKLLKREVSINATINPLYQKFGERLAAIRTEFERRQIDLAERIKAYTDILEAIQTARSDADANGLDIREEGLFYSLKEFAKGDEQILKTFVHDFSNRLETALDSGWQDSPKREEFIKDIKRQVQEMVLKEYRDKLKIQDIHGCMNRLVDVAIKRY